MFLPILFFSHFIEVLFTYSKTYSHQSAQFYQFQRQNPVAITTVKIKISFTTSNPYGPLYDLQHIPLINHSVTSNSIILHHMRFQTLIIV